MITDAANGPITLLMGGGLCGAIADQVSRSRTIPTDLSTASYVGFVQDCSSSQYALIPDGCSVMPHSEPPFAQRPQKNFISGHVT